jgi:hypothetical protein
VNIFETGRELPERVHSRSCRQDLVPQQRMCRPYSRSPRDAPLQRISLLVLCSVKQTRQKQKRILQLRWEWKYNNWPIGHYPSSSFLLKGQRFGDWILSPSSEREMEISSVDWAQQSRQPVNVKTILRSELQRELLPVANMTALCGITGWMGKDLLSMLTCW